jgi:hypothetical protein
MCLKGYSGHELLFLAAILVLPACTGSKEQKLAQCQLDAFSSKGDVFRTNYAEGKFVPSGKDGSYREFMLTCMQAQGYEFAPPFNKDGENRACWIEDKQGIIPDAYVDGASCYTRKWW